MARAVCVALVGLAPLTPSPALAADEDKSVRDEVARRMAEAWSREDFATLEAMQDDFLDPARRTASGKRLLAVFSEYLWAFVSVRPTDEVLRELLTNQMTTPPEESRGPVPERYEAVNREWDRIGARVTRWRTRFPNSPHPPLAVALYYIKRGGYFRGLKAAREVRAEAWPVLHENAQRAREVLIQSKTLSRRNPIWFELSLAIQDSVSKDEIRDLAAETIEHGQAYLPALAAAFCSLSPRWGGSYAELEQFAAAADQATMAQEHGEVYARLYWRLVGLQRDELDQGFFKRTEARWPALKKSFEGLVERYPEPRNVAAYALFACMAGEIPKVAELLARPGAAFYSAAWPSALRAACLPSASKGN